MSAQGIARGVVLAAAAAGMVWTAHAAPVRTSTGERLATTTSAVEAASLVCPGGAGSNGSTEVNATSSPESLTPFAREGGGASARLESSSDPKAMSLERGGATVTEMKGGPLVVEATGGMAPGFAAAQISGGDGKSPLVARTCAASLNEAWIPVGQKGSSRLSTLVLVNSGSHGATVDIDVSSRDGDVAGAAITDKAVPAHSRVEVNLPTEAKNHDGVVVHVRSESGAVQASVRDSASSGSTKGEELTAQYAVPGTTQIVPAAPVTDGKTSVRLAAPAGRGAVVKLSALSTQGEASKDRVVSVPRGRTLDVSLDGLKGSTVAVRATSEAEIVAAATAPAASGSSADFAWAQAAPDIGPAAGTALRGAGTGGDLVLAASAPQVRATVVVTTKDGKSTTQHVDVRDNAARRISVPKDASVWVTAPTKQGESHLHAGIVLRTGSKSSDRITTLTLTAAPWMREQTALVAR